MRGERKFMQRMTDREIVKYENADDIIDTALWKEDEVTFSVLTGIINYGCRCVITDHRDFVICYSCSPYPVWVWVRGGAEEELLETVWEITDTKFPKEQGFRYVMKYSTADFFLKKAEKKRNPLSVQVNMLTYVCRHPKEPQRKTDGGICPASMEDLEEMTEFSWLFRRETGVDLLEREACRQAVEKMIRSGCAYLWKDAAGRNAAMCSYHADNGLGRVTHVYTRPDARRRGYAQRLVYEVTRMIKQQGVLPAIYTDADYAASNACYRGIGYEQVGSLCTLAGQVQQE